ncbi:methylated-DNA--[protein]-cysteine S-methyltransferase [Clostridium saccharoperbutylacetonicum]|uniref:Methylated-DNA--protein-cysteine methyltransferase n=1 Tax=Clostridium saccharoperbutylacetonicum N1-4(HMT) TaxID=931276 RepID=M1M931_9CLOT|nr:methylated-DNA--[protein]-cysteine S-methyltransferase [Clostridium saccharoperbutylacetonicum]AGF54449.1 methylated-DNA--protein-cysteine methyltransferase Ogt [Clostridium saccharoperbutylacetonicum N1-4(HMT)]AQR93386.1 methylated-DNA--protein-cysteine methyltransferase [Clostridium saccharoperbutylacetonicum]NRT59031.1 methylated-DNA-[protein]-cysteine S-methyltransferase [Clostridium saccharoperbutylacetonicum]NSB28219.1 methylated-DNA-[protein]-cysteine S-methyltransferase [Clostridium 
MKNIFYYESKIGLIKIEESGISVTKLDFVSNNDKENIIEGSKTELLIEIVKQLDEYFDGTRKVFDLPIEPEGTEFQKKVWKALIEIPYGETKSYGEIAKIIGNDKAARAVGMANNKNPIAIIIPCHRVIGANGNLVGYAGGLELKEKLLELEKRSIIVE